MIVFESISGTGAIIVSSFTSMCIVIMSFQFTAVAAIAQLGERQTEDLKVPC